jgi:fatty-acid desaturase
MSGNAQITAAVNGLGHVFCGVAGYNRSETVRECGPRGISGLGKGFDAKVAA